MAATKAMQFDGTLGCAKQIASWVGDPEKVNAGPWNHFNVNDADQGGLDLIGKDANDAPLYTTVNPTDYVVRSDDGSQFVVFSEQQYAVAFPAPPAS